jgi:hypothetical protein
MMQGLVSGKHRAREKSGTEATHFTIDGEWSSTEDSSGIPWERLHLQRGFTMPFIIEASTLTEALHVSKHL